VSTLTQNPSGRPVLSRRALLPLALAGACARQRGSGYHGWAFVALQGSRPGIVAVDLRGFHVRKRIPLDAAPSSIFPHPDPASGRVLALVPQARRIEEIDVRSLSLTRSFSLPAPPIAAKPGIDGRSIWSLTAHPPAIHGTDLTTAKPIRTIPLPGTPASWDLHPRQPAAAVALQSGELLFLDLRTGAVHQAGAISADPGPLVFRSDGRLLLAADRTERALSVFDFATRDRLVDLPLALRPDRLCMLSNGGQIFLTGHGHDAVVIAYPYRTEIAQTTLSGRRPAEMAASEAPPYLFVSNPDAGSVTVFNIASQKVMAVTGVGIRPGPLAITPDQQYALVLHTGSGDLGVIRIASITSRRAKSAPLFTMVPIGEQPVGMSIIPSPPA
jgi:hypothetical protein